MSLSPIEFVSLSKCFTAEQTKKKPVYRWFYYKESFSPCLLDFISCLHRPKSLGDPFCGAGTTLVWAKEHGIPAVGYDVFPLSVFASKVKTANYDKKELLETLETLEPAKEGINWRFELFPPSRAFPKRNYNMIVRLRLAIEELDFKVGSFFLLALISILQKVGYFYRDGGVLRLRKRPVPDALKVFRKKAKLMIQEAHTAGIIPTVKEKSAFEFEEEVDTVVTSPPYLNNVDYTKIYGLELSLLTLEEKPRCRGEMFRSFIRREVEGKGKIPIEEAYFEDSERVLKRLNAAHIFWNVSNSFIHGTYIPVDEKIADILSSLGYKTKIYVGIVRKTKIAGRLVKVRESLVYGWI